MLRNLIDFLILHHYYSVQFFGAFFGAFFALVVFVFGERIVRKWDRKKMIRNEHASLERYFGDVYQLVQQNRRMTQDLITDYSSNTVNLFELIEIPMREEASMKVSDMLFVNHLEFFTSDIKATNRKLMGINQLKERLNEDLLASDQERKKRGSAAIVGFIDGLNVLVKEFDFLLDECDDRAAENQVLLEKMKNWRLNNSKIDSQFAKREKSIQAEREVIIKVRADNPFNHDRAEKLKKFGLDRGEQTKEKE